MPYAIMRFKKTGTGGIAPAQKHNEREKTKYKSNPDIDTARIMNDYHIIKPNKPYRAVIKDRLAETGCRTRKDSVLMVETILTASPEFMHALPPEEQKKFFQLATQFFEKEIGKENIISAIVHMDEKTPHMHLCFVPLTPDGHLSAKKIIGDRQKLCRWQDLYHNFMAKEFPDLERGRAAKKTGRQHIPTWMIKRASALEKEGQEIADLFGSINRFNAPKIKEEIETKFPAWVKQVEILSAQISSANIGIAHWKREAAEAKKTSREAWIQMAEMNDKYTELLTQLDYLRRYEKYMPEETRRELDSARKQTMRMIYGDFER